MAVKYTDGYSENITEGMAFSGFDSSEVGAGTIVVNYKDKETSFGIQIYDKHEMNVHSHVYTDAVDRVCDKCEYKRTLVSIGVEGIENKKSYCLDELFDYKGFVLQLVYDDASKEVIREGYEVLSFDSSNTKEEKVIISYEGLQTSYDVTIVEHKYGSDTDDTCDVCHKKYTEGNFIYRVEQGKVIIISCATSVQDEVVVSTEMGKREVVKIAPGAFKGCQQMTKITLPDSIISIGATAFKNCYALQNITIPKNVKCIQNGTFYNCSDLREVLLSENLERIEQEAFKNCYGLKKIFIPKSVTNIGDDAFYGTNMVFYINSAYSKYYVLSNNMAYVLVPEKLEVKTLPEKISYSLGESFSSNGLVLNAVFYEDTNEDISEGYIITGFDSSKTGVCTITVEYASKIVTFDVVIHDYKTIWNADGSEHWHECSVCGDKKDIEQHEYDNACDTDCNICGKERSIIHEYGKAWTQGEENHWHECSVCGDKIDIERHTYDNACDTDCNICGRERAIKHDYKVAWTQGEENHWHECSVCGDKTDIAKHVYDNACDTDCNICGKERTTKHDYKEEWTQGEESHWHECAVCEDKVDIEKHIYDNACDTICNVCHYEREHVKPDKLEVITMPTKSEYILGEEYDLTLQGLVLKATYFDGTTEIITSGYEIDGMDSDEEGIQKIWVVYHGAHAEIRFIVHDYTTEWSVDKTSHWHDCKLCDSKADMGTHHFGNWQVIGGTWYYFAGSGAMVTGWQFVGGVWYYFAGSGAMVTGWQFVDGVWYYFEGSGAMVANRWVGNYYLQADGSMATNKWIGIYYVGADGAWIP